MQSEPKSLMQMLGDLYEAAEGTHLAHILLESIGAAQQHAAITVRLGANRDGAISIFSAEPELGGLMAEILTTENRALHVGQVPRLDPETFRTILLDDSLTQTLLASVRSLEVTPDTVYDRTPDGWSPSLARAFLRDMTANQDLPEVQVAMLTAALEEPDCAASEGRFRALLHEARGWKAADLDQAVAKVRGAT
jgi:hypothetical protein